MNNLGNCEECGAAFDIVNLTDHLSGCSHFYDEMPPLDDEDDMLLNYIYTGSYVKKTPHLSKAEP